MCILLAEPNRQFRWARQSELSATFFGRYFNDSKTTEYKSLGQIWSATNWYGISNFYNVDIARLVPYIGLKAARKTMQVFDYWSRESIGINLICRCKNATLRCSVGAGEVGVSEWKLLQPTIGTNDHIYGSKIRRRVNPTRYICANLRQEPHLSHHGLDRSDR